MKEEDRTGEDYEDTGTPPVCIRLLQVPSLSKTAKYRVFPYDEGQSATRTRSCREAVVQSAMRTAFEAKAKAIFRKLLSFLRVVPQRVVPQLCRRTIRLYNFAGD